MTTSTVNNENPMMKLWESSYTSVNPQEHLSRRWKLAEDVENPLSIIQLIPDKQKPHLPEGYLWFKDQKDLQILKHIDTFIPYPILFVLKKSGYSKLAISYKEQLSAKNTLMKVSDYFDTDWQSDIDIELKGRSVDEIYKNFLHQIAPNLNLKSALNVKEAVANNQTREKIIKQIDALNRAILNEPSIAKQQMLARERYSLEQQL